MDRSHYRSAGVCARMSCVLFNHFARTVGETSSNEHRSMQKEIHRVGQIYSGCCHFFVSAAVSVNGLPASEQNDTVYEFEVGIAQYGHRVHTLFHSAVFCSAAECRHDFDFYFIYTPEPDKLSCPGLPRCPLFCGGYL